MATWDTVCDILRALPETELDEPAWRFNGKVLARNHPRLRVPDEAELRAEYGELAAIRVYDRAERDALVREQPSVFFVTPHWESSLSVLVRLAEVSDEQLREVITDSWLSLAPKQLSDRWQCRPDAGNR
jgi:hypothetical protein